LGGGGGIVFSSFAFGDSVRLRRGRPLVVVLVVVSETAESVFDAESTVVSGDSGRGLFAGRADELFEADDDDESTLVEEIFSDSFFFSPFRFVFKSISSSLSPKSNGSDGEGAGES